MAGEISINGEDKSIRTPSLLDEEARIVAEKRAAISRVTLEVEAVFLREDMTMGDLLEVFGLLTNRSNEVFSEMKIKLIKEKHGTI